jgi:hypothetical protein
LWPLAVALFAGSAVISGHAATVEMVPTKDTFIAQYFPDKNFGAMPFLNSGTTQNYATNRGLMRFDLTPVIPAGSKILSVTLTTEVVGDPDEEWNTAHFGLHRVLRDWGEGDNTAGLPRDASPAALNEANWAFRFAHTEATWGTPGGQPGVDYVAAPSGSTFVYHAGDPYTFDSSMSLVNDVQLWLDHPGTNFGWMLILRNETEAFTARRFASRESGEDAPLLYVEFQPPPPIENVQVHNNTIQFEFVTAASFAHQVEYCDDLQSELWFPLESVGPSINDARVTVAYPVSGPQRFYRIKVL